VIGVISKTDQVEVVQEFFELFKTPWEFYQPGRAYDVVVTTGDDVPGVDAHLHLVYGPETTSTDERHGIVVKSRHRGATLDYQGGKLPIFGELVTFEESGHCVPCLSMPAGVVGLRGVSVKRTTVVRVGYDLFQEVRLLLSQGQPVGYAHTPTLDLHITMLRNWILNEGIALLEIPPVPAGHDFAVCLTHDIDFVGIRYHKCDHTMWGFLYRATFGAARNLLRGRISISRMLNNWRAAASLPFVHLGWAQDFWEPFSWYLQVEKDLPATYFLIPFKRHAGEYVPGQHALRRAAAYDVGDLSAWTATLQSRGCELGVHGIDAWHSVESGRSELRRLERATGEPTAGIRMHWLLENSNTASVLEQSGYAYDSTAGYNETIGYRCGTSQVFRPLGAEMLLELPLHIQDGALFYPDKLDLSEQEAETRCSSLIRNARQLGGVLTILWHDRSHGPERFWGDFYVRLLQTLRSLNPWFGTGAQVVGWFRKRRNVRFGRADIDRSAHARVTYRGDEIQPPLKIRIYISAGQKASCATAPEFMDITWNGKSVDEVERKIASCLARNPGAVMCSFS
jgi:hypothetical protein